MSLESPPTENGHSLGEIISTVLPENATVEDKRSGNNVNGANATDIFAQANRAPGSGFGRNGSITPPFEENGVASPIDDQKFSIDSASLGTSIDSAMVTATNTFAKNRFLSGDHVNANNRDALFRRQLFAIGKLAQYFD